jgi:hypothetical protein
MELFINGNLYIGVYDTYWGASNSSTTSVSYVEMQHIYYTRDTNDDQPTYMDNIIISDTYNGAAGVSPSTPTPSISGVDLQ